MSDRDIMEEMQRSSSAKRYRPEGTSTNGTGIKQVTRARASLTAEQPLVVRTAQPQNTTTRQRRTAEYAVEPTTRAPRTAQQELLCRTTQTYQQQRPLPDTDTDADVEVAPRLRRSERPAPPTRHLPPMQGQQSTRFHWLVYVGIGMMISLLVLWVIGVQVKVAWTNNVYNPSYYTQTAHLDMVTITTDAQGHQSQARAFLDAQNHLDLLLLPIGGDASKGHVVVGPTPAAVTDLQHATITMAAHGTVVSVIVQGPLEPNYLSTTQQSSSWTVDLKKVGGQ